MEASVLDMEGKKVGKLQLPETVFGQKPSAHFLHEFVTSYLASQRLGTAHTKTRSEVSGGGRKPWKQKHTGRARHGSIRSPLWRKGGVVFGPRPRSYRQELPEAKRRLALVQALSAKHLEGKLVVLKSLELKEPKTKYLAQVLKKIGASPKAFLVLEEAGDIFRRAARNLNTLEWSLAQDINAYRVLRGGCVVFTESAVTVLGGKFK